jgi:post-segregation antitoxin (ccd killing protein)
MVGVLVTVELPKELEEKARAAGLLTSEKLAALIEAEVERQRQEAWERLSEAMDKVSASFRAKFGHLTDEEAQAMIDQWLHEVGEKIRDEARDASIQAARETLVKLDALEPKLTEDEIAQV